MLQGCGVTGVKSGGCSCMWHRLIGSPRSLLSLGCCLDIILNSPHYYIWMYGARSIVEKAHSDTANSQYERTICEVVSFCLNQNESLFSGHSSFVQDLSCSFTLLHQGYHFSDTILNSLYTSRCLSVLIPSHYLIQELPRSWVKHQLQGRYALP